MEHHTQHHEHNHRAGQAHEAVPRLVEVHSIDRADDGQGEEYGLPCGDLFDLLVLGETELREVAHFLVVLLPRQGGIDRQQSTEPVHPFHNAQHVVTDVTEPALQRLVQGVLPDLRRRASSIRAVGGWRAGTR